MCHGVDWCILYVLWLFKVSIAIVCLFVLDWLDVMVVVVCTDASCMFISVTSTKYSNSAVFLHTIRHGKLLDSVIWGAREDNKPSAVVHRYAHNCQSINQPLLARSYLPVWYSHSLCPAAHTSLSYVITTNNSTTQHNSSSDSSRARARHNVM